MKFLNRFFKSKPAARPKRNPDNIRLIFLLNTYSQHRSNKKHELVMKELLEGNSFLILPTNNSRITDVDDWTTIEKDTQLQLTSVRDLDDLKALAAFSSEKSLVNWTKRTTPFTKLKSQDVFEIC